MTRKGSTYSVSLHKSEQLIEILRIKKILLGISTGNLDIGQ